MDARYLKAWWKALRAFSFTIAFISCLLGVALARVEGEFDWPAAIGVLVAGILFQAGVNLINDFFEFKQGKLDDKIPHLAILGQNRTTLEWSIYFGGLLCLALIGPIGLWLSWRAGWPLFVLGLVGVVGAYSYTGEPFNYKRRGLAVVLVFFLMGVLMISGSHLALARFFSPASALIAVPISALVSLLLLSNELRDFEDDTRHGIRTLTVRIGYDRAVALYWAIVVVAYGGALALWPLGYLPHPWFVVASLVALPAPLRYLRAPRADRRPLTPLTARLHFVFGLLFTLTYLVPLGHGARALDEEARAHPVASQAR